MRTNNQKVIKRMAEYILENMDKSEVERYKKEFPFEYDYNIYAYGNLDIYDYDLFKRLKDFGVDMKAVTEYEKVLGGGCTYKHRENIRNTYMALVHNAVNYISKREKILLSF